MRSKSFLFGFFGGLLLFFDANLLSYSRMKAEPVLTDAYVSFGIPLTVYAASGFGGETVLWGNIIANAMIALSVSTLVGWAVAKLFTDSAAP